MVDEPNPTRQDAEVQGHAYRRGPDEQPADIEGHRYRWNRDEEAPLDDPTGSEQSEGPDIEGHGFALRPPLIKQPPEARG